ADLVMVSGSALVGDDLAVLLRGLPGEIVLPAEAVVTQAPRQVSFRLPDDQEGLPAGAYLVALRWNRPGLVDPTPQRVTSSALPLLTAPRLLEARFVPAEGTDPPRISVRCSPRVWPGQQVRLLIADRELLPDPAPQQKTHTLSFPLSTPLLDSGRHV